LKKKVGIMVSMEKRIETQNVEFKSNWRDEYLKVISAFSNSDGGVLYVGLDDDGKPVEVKKIRKLLEDIPNKIRNKLGVIPSVEVENYEDKEVIKITVRSQAAPISYDGRYYLRSGSTNLELQGNELVDFLLKKHGRGWDEITEVDSGLQDISDETIEKFKGYARDRIPSIASERDNKAILEKLNLISNNKLKRAALILFGKNPQKFYPSAHLRIGKFLSETDILTSDIVRGNLFEQLENSLEILRTKYLLSEIKFEGIHRREILEYPHRALRESILNALIHRNYLGSSAVQVRVYDDRIVFMNEGKLPPEVPVEKLKMQHLSKPGNTLLADVFYKAGFIESWGRGTLEIVDKCLKQNLPEPEFIEEFGVFQVVLYKSRWNEETLKKAGLNDRQVKAVFYTRKNGKITNKEYIDLNGVSKATATRDLKELTAKNIFKQHGIKGQGLFYRVIGS
jgi:ATP-dependent DNA helicase RecG